MKPCLKTTATTKVKHTKIKEATMSSTVSSAEPEVATGVLPVTSSLRKRNYTEKLRAPNCCKSSQEPMGWEAHKPQG